MTERASERAGSSAPKPAALSGLVTGVPRPLRHREIPGFLSAAQLAPHHTAHYRGALEAFVDVEKRFEGSFATGAVIDPLAFQSMKRLQSSRGNSVLLHELYFDGMSPRRLEGSGALRGAIEGRFGSMDRWAADFVGCAKAAAGWAVLMIHPVNGRLYNVLSDEHADGPLWLGVPLVVIDTYEHAFYIDYHNRKAKYVERFLDHIDWAQAELRHRQASKV